MTIKQGDIVKIKPEFQDEGDDQYTFVALEDEDGGRVLIGAQGVLQSFIPSQVVTTNMLETD